MNPKTLQYLMGHSDIGVTMNVYTYLGLEGCGCGDVQDGEGRIASERAGPDFRWRKEYGEAERENVQSNLNEVGAHR